MSTGNVAWAQNQGFAAQALKIRRFGAKRHCLGAMPGQTFGDAHQFGIGGLFERRYFGKQRRIVYLHLMQFCLIAARNTCGSMPGKGRKSNSSEHWPQIRFGLSPP